MRVGNYTLSELLGRGGTSEVYAAQHRFLGDAVAIKLLRAGAAADESVRAAFVAEAARTREIQHPNVVRVVDFGHDDASGSLYLVMERIAGETLAARLRRAGRLDEPTLRRLAASIADGLGAAHARGIVHRDLKPGNVMLRAGAGDAPVIVDFGIAKSLGSSSAVHTERRIGTVAYMAPEQLTDGLITPAADIWALGVILYEAATGQLPFGNFADGRLPQLFDTPPRAATLAPISPALDDLIARCLDRDPGKRPTSMVEIAAALRGESDERITADAGGLVAPPLQPPPPPAQTAAPRARSRTRWTLVAAGLACAGVAIAGLLASRDGARDEPRDEAAIETKALPVPAAIDAGMPAEATAIVDATAAPAEATAIVDATATPGEPAGHTAPPASAERASKTVRVKRKHRKRHVRHERHERTTSQGETLD